MRVIRQFLGNPATSSPRMLWNILIQRQVRRLSWTLIARAGMDIWPLESDDVYLAWRLRSQFPALTARDLCHLASCRRRGVTDIKTVDRAFGSAVRALR